ncbi:hypothetical protein L3Q82_015389, partial [Scortum barcoo]
KREVSAEQDGRASGAETRLQREYQECSLMHFTETLAEPPQPGLTGAAGQVSSRQSGQEYKGRVDIDSLTDCITDYINFCVETTVPTKRVRCFSNNKPWVTPDLRALLLEKRTAFQSGDRDELRRGRGILKRKIKECKASYRRKMEDHLQQNNVREVWRGLWRAISGQGRLKREEEP